MLHRLETILRAANPDLRKPRAAGARFVAEARETIRLYVAHSTGGGERPPL